MKLIVIFLSLFAPSLAVAADIDSSTGQNFEIRKSQPSTRTINFKAKIDGSQNIIIQDGKLHILHTGWEKLIDISINGKKWTPDWTENITNDFSSFDPPLAPFKDSSVKVKAVRGRGIVTITETPTKTNNYKLVIRVADEEGGADNYYIRIFW